jgi:hypothetical protein
MMTNSSDCNRPIHTSIDVNVRSLQMGDINLFVFVEGDEDGFFYGNLCSAVLSGTGLSHKIINPMKLPCSSFGKKALIELFKYLDSKSILVNEHKGKKTGFLFFLDKDVDDLMDLQINSEHIVYTYFFDVENHIIEHGDLIRGCAVAAAMDPQEIARCIGNQADWLRNAAQLWKDWVKICVFAKVKILEKCPHNYMNDSQINAPLTGAVDKRLWEESRAKLKSASGLSETNFSGEYDRISRFVDDLYEKGKHGKVFKGKWYKRFLVEQIRQLVKTTCGKEAGFEGHIFRDIAGTLDFKADWTKYFSQPLQRVIDKLAEIDPERVVAE